MAPLAVDIPDLGLSSLELDSRASMPDGDADQPADSSLSQRDLSEESNLIFSHTLHKRHEDGVPILSPAETFETLTRRTVTSTATINPAAGSINPNDINMKAVQAIFAIIGASFVIGAIWFFFWAKNGGFQWRKDDWEEYKSTVLRRKGPNGTTLSNATKSTKLGGGSIVGQGFSDDGSTSWEGTNTVTDMSSEAPVIKEKSKRSKKVNAKAAKIREVKEEKWEGGHDDDMRAYRQEQPARVGGLNTTSDSQYYGTDYASSDGHSNGHSNSQRNSWKAPPPQYSSRNNSPEKRQSRRDFSYGNDDQFTTSRPSPPKHSNNNNSNNNNNARPNRYRSPEKPARASRVSPGSFSQDADTDYSDLQSQNTKSYHHPLPGVPSNGKNTAGRAKAGGVTGGYRRDRRSSLGD